VKQTSSNSQLGGKAASSQGGKDTQDRESPTVFLAKYMRKRNKDLEIHKKFKILDQEL